MGIFGKHGRHEAGHGAEHEDLTQYVHGTVRHMPHDDTGGRLGEEEGSGAELMAEALEGFEEHLHHPEWHPGEAAEPPSSDVEPPSSDVEPPSSDVEPLSSDAEPLSSDAEPPSSDVGSPSSDVEGEPRETNG